MLVVNRRLSRYLAVRRKGSSAGVVLVGAGDDITLAEEHLADSDRDAVVVGRVERTDLISTVEEFHATDVLLLDVGTRSARLPRSR